MRKILYLSIVVIGLVACNSSTKNTENTSKIDTPAIPKDAIPIIYNEYVLAQGSVDSVQGSFLVDLGSDRLFLDSFFVHTSLFKSYKSEQSSISGVGNTTQNANEIKDSIHFAFNRLKYQTSNVTVADLKCIGGDLIDGLIGTDLLAGSVLEINYAYEYIRLFDNIDSADTAGYKVIHMKKINNFFCIPLSIKVSADVTINGDFVIDTGSPGSEITTSVASKNDLKHKIKRKIRYYTAHGGVGGESSGYDFYSESLQIAGFCLKDPTISFSADTFGILSKDKYMGLIGNNILERFDIMFDFKNIDLYIRPNKDFNKPFVLDRFGFYYIDRSKTMGGWIITGLVENSQAEKLGLQVDDKIVSMNGIPVNKISYKDQVDDFSKIDKVKFVIKNAQGTRTVEYKLTPIL